MIAFGRSASRSTTSPASRSTAHEVAPGDGARRRARCPARRRPPVLAVTGARRTSPAERPEASRSTSALSSRRKDPSLALQCSSPLAEKVLPFRAPQDENMPWHTTYAHAARPHEPGLIDHRGSPHETLRGSIALARPPATTTTPTPTTRASPTTRDRSRHPSRPSPCRFAPTWAPTQDAWTPPPPRPSAAPSSPRSASSFPNADVREACVTPRDGISATAVGVWTSATPPNGDPARELGLQRVGVIDPGEGIAIYVNGGFIRGQVHEQFDRVPKRYNGLGNPSPDGPIHVTGSISTSSVARTAATGA